MTLEQMTLEHMIFKNDIRKMILEQMTLEQVTLEQMTLNKIKCNNSLSNVSKARTGQRPGVRFIFYHLLVVIGTNVIRPNVTEHMAFEQIELFIM
jgi:hypothetical protein